MGGMGSRRLDGRIALVTGATYGIGFAAAERFALEGATVVLADIKGHDISARTLAERGLYVHAMTLDVTDDRSVTETVDEIVTRFGRIDILVNNAAISAELTPEPFEQQSIDDWRRVYEVNVLGMFRMCRAVSPHMRAARSGRIINLTSGTAFKGAPGMLHYIASKGAIISMTRSLATEFGPDNVTVNAVSPGMTMTESVVAAGHFSGALEQFAVGSRILKRPAAADDVANAIYFFASDDGGFVTGQILAADGGALFH